MKILILTAAPANIAANQRFRFEHYINLTEKGQLTFKLSPFYSRNAWDRLHKPGFLIAKVWAIFLGFLHRFAELLSLSKYDYVYVHREASPIGPPVFEWLITKVFRKRLIYDFDDAIWVKTASKANPWVAGIKCTWKVASICRYSSIVTVGNQFLADYAGKFCSDVRVIPTVVDTNHLHNKLKDQQENPLILGWTGTFTNFSQLEKLVPVIKRLGEAIKFETVIISNKDPHFENIVYTYKPWALKTEIEDLLGFHVGVMPLHNSTVELGKCGFKAIQYMSLGIPAVVSPVGANMEVVVDNKTGFWAETENEWYDKIKLLLDNSSLREHMGASGRKHIEQHYSVDATKQQFYTLFD